MFVRERGKLQAESPLPGEELHKRVIVQRSSDRRAFKGSSVAKQYCRIDSIGNTFVQDRWRCYSLLRGGYESRADLHFGNQHEGWSWEVHYYGSPGSTCGLSLTSTMNKKVLAIDLDPQANLSQAFMVKTYQKFIREGRPSIVDIFNGYHSPSRSSGSTG